MTNVFLDANVILEVLLKRSHYMQGAAVLKAGEQNRIDLFTSPSVIGFVAYWMIKDVGQSKTKELLTGLLDFIKTIDISHKQLIDSFHSDFKDIEDGIQYYTSLQHGLDYMVTFNKADFRKAKGEVKVASPDELMKIIS